MNERAQAVIKEPFDIGDLSPRRYFMWVALALGVIFAFVAGEGEGGSSLLRNLIQWQLQSCVPMLLLLFAHMLWSRWSWFEQRGPWTQLLVSGITGSLAFALPALLIDIYLLGDASEGLSLADLADEFLNLAPPVTLTWLAINAPFVLGLRLRAVEVKSPRLADNGVDRRADNRVDNSDSTQGATFTPRFMRLLPDNLRGEVLYLEAELHYLSVVTERGKALILYNLRDAIADMGDVPGVQTHRAFWVRRDQVEGFSRNGRQGRVRMRNGEEVPVSRRRLASTAAMLA